MPYQKDLTVRGRQIRLTEISRRSNNNSWEYYHSGREDYKPRIIPIGNPFLVISPSVDDPRKIDEDLEFYLEEANIGDEFFKRIENPILLALLRGFDHTLRSGVYTSSKRRFSSLSLIVPYQFFILEE